ncbi:MAG: fibronectin type III domain-containing protein [Bacteroidetes bacterium]|nr:fibronectin type III domain-containing protein [Bacteroidota bacterium]
MKKLLILSVTLFMFLVFNQTHAQPFTSQNPGLPLTTGSRVVWGDYDNDGDLDLLFSGYQSSTSSSLIYLLKNTNGSFSNSGVILKTPASADAPNLTDFGDVNNDGYLDILVCGNYDAGLYINNRAGGFTLSSLDIPKFSYAVGGFADLNNDGLLDILTNYYTFINQGNMSFTGKSNNGIPFYAYNALDFGDYDLDGFLDISLVGGGLTRIFKNDGAGLFSDIGAGLPGFDSMNSIPGAKWGDYDQDGDPDLLIYGYYSPDFKFETALFENQGFGVFAYKVSDLPFFGGSGVWADMDSDGDLDVVCSGYNYDGTTFLSLIYLNDGKGSFVDSGISSLLTTNVPNVTVVDYQNDMDPDILITGSDSNRLYRNGTSSKNTAPTPPDNLKIEPMGTGMSFMWSGATDAQNSADVLTYNLRIGTLSAPNSIRSAPTDQVTGFHRVVKPGNAGLQSQIFVNGLIDGETYKASIMSVDNSYAGSPLSTDQTFTLKPSVPALMAATGISETGFTINWMASYGATSYQVMVSRDATFSLPLTGFDPLITEFNYAELTGLTKYQTYYVKVAAVNSGGVSEYSEVKAIMATDGLAAKYDFAGDNKDSGPFNAHLSQTGNVAMTADRFGNANSAVYFDGNYSNLNADASNLPTRERTLSAWVKMEDTTSIRTIFGYGGNGNYATSQIMSWGRMDTRYGWMSSAMMAGYSNTHSLFSPSTGNPIGNWVHMVTVVDQTGTRIYINNQLVASNTDFNTDTYVDGKKLFIGIEPHYEGVAPQLNPFKGAIDDIRIYNRVLTAAERLALFAEDGYNPTPDVAGLTITKITGGTITASWNSITGNPLFEVQVATDATFINTVPGYGSFLTSQNSVKITGLSGNTDYYIRVRSKGYNLAGTFANAPVVKTTDGIVAQFDFSGNGKDSGPFGKDMTAVGATLVSDRFGNPNSAYRFNETRNTYLVGDASELPTAERTVAMWVKTEEVGSYSLLLTYGGTNYGSYQFAWNPGNPGRWEMKDYYTYWLVSQATESTLGKWIHLVSTTGKNGSKIFVNGNLVASNATFYNATNVTGKKIMVGASLNSDGTAWEGNGFVGTIDDIKIYDLELTEAEIFALTQSNGYNPTPDITGLSITKITGSTFSAIWDKPADVDNYEYQVASDLNFNQLISGYESKKIATNSVKVVGLNPNQDYYFRVRSLGYEQRGNFNSYSHVHTTDGLVAKFDFSGNSTDSGPFGKNLTSMGASLTTDRFGNANSAYYLDGNTHLIGDGSELPSRERAVSMWVKLNVTTGYNYLLSYGGGNTNQTFNLRYINNQWQIVDYYESWYLSAQQPESPKDSWVHLVAMTGPTGSKIYVNGELKSSNASFLSTTQPVGNKLVIGARSRLDGTDIDGYRMTGSVDDIRIYDRELTESEILNFYAEGNWVPSPSAPVAQQSPSVSDLSFVAKWNPVDNATGYYLDVSKDPEFLTFINGYAGFETTGTEVSVTGLTELTTYYYRVRAFNLAGASGYSNSVSLTTLQSPLTAPVALAAVSVQDNGFLAKWEPQSAPGQYQIEVATDVTFANLIAGYNPRTIDNINSVSSLVVAGLQPVTTYFYRLRGIRGTEVSDYSNVVDVTTKATPVVPDRPVVLDATAIDLHQFTANWRESNGALSYNVYVATDSLFTSQLTNWDPKNVTETSVIVNALNAGRKYWYRVKAVNAVGPSAYSDSVKVETLFSAPVSQPSSLPTNGGFTANWLPVTNAAYYLLDVSKNADFTDLVAGFENLRVNGTSSEITGITVSSDYFYRVRAVSAFGVVSPSSNHITVSVTYNEIVAPVATEATFVNQDSFVANWNDVPGAAQYEVQLTTDGFLNFTSKTTLAKFVTFSTLSPLTDYEYRVRAKIAGVWSDWSNTIQVTTSGTLNPPVLVVSNEKTTSFDLSWTAVDLATGYTVVVAKKDDFTELFDSLYTTSTSMTVNGLTEDDTYYVKGYSVKGKFSSVASEVHTVKTLSGLPDAPVATDATNVTVNSYQANWNPVANAQSYEVQQSTNDFVTWVKQNVTDTKATFSSLSPSTTYKYQVNVTDNAGKTSKFSNIITVITKSASPAKPVLNEPTLVAQSGFTLTWTSDPPSVEYYVDVASQEDFAVTSLLPDYKNKKVTATTLAVTGLGQGLKFWARVRGYDGKVYGEYSNVVSATTLNQTLSTPVLNAPSAINPTSFTISWSDITGETGYQIDVSLVSSFSPNLIGYNNKDLATNSETVINLQPGTLYYVRVRAVNKTTATFSSYSATAQVPTTVAVPELLDPDQIQTTSFRAKWNPVTNVGSYRLDVSKDNTFTQMVSGYNDKVIPSSSTSLVVNNLTKKTMYYYRMRAVKGTFTSDHSQFKSVTTEDEAVIPAVALQAKDTTSTGFIAQWENPGVGYTVTLDIAADDLFASKIPGYNEKSVTGKSEEDVTGLNPFTTYYYRIKVTNVLTSYAYSNTITVKTRVAKVAVNDAAKIKSDSFEISWPTVNGATDYAILVSKNNIMFPQLDGYPKTTKSSPFTVSGLDEKTQYYFAVAAYNSEGTGDISTIKNVTTEATPTLATPVLNSPTDRTQSGFTISWGVVPGATGYRYDLALDNAFTQTVTGYVDEPTSATSVIVAGREPNTTYYFRVKATTNTDESGYAVSDGIKTLPTLPGVPTVSAPTGESPISFTANWQTASSAESYLLDVSTDQNFVSGVWILQNEPVSATQKLVSGLTPSTDYYYRVRAKNEAGESGNSGTQKATTTSGKPEVPVLSALSSVTSTGFTINWSAPNGGPESYRLDVGTNNPITVFVDGYQDKTVTGTSETLTGLTSGMTFFYQVRAVNGYGTSASSQVGTALLIPAPPTASSATNETSTSFTANWQAETGASGYFLDVSQSNLFTSFESGYENRPVSGTSATVSGLTTNRTYHYRVRAANASGISGNSNVISLTLLPLVPAFSGLNITPSTAVLGTSDVEVKITVANSPVGVFLFYGSPTASALTQTTMTLSGGQYVATINKSSYGKEGLVFRISAENEKGKTWYPAENQVTSIPVNVPAQNIISEVIPTSSFPTGIEKETWNTLSLPFTGSVNLTTILGTQELSNGEPINWAAYTFNGDFVSTTTLSGGQAIFLYHKSGDGANLIKNTVNSAGTIVTYDQNAFGNTLLANGWNLVAWPYTYGAQVSVKDGTKISSVWQMKAGSWEKNSSVKPFGGYAIYNKTGTGGLKVSDVLSWTTQSLSKSGSADLAQYDADWLLKLGVTSETSSDSWNYIGVSQQASSGLDLLDERNPFAMEASLDLFVAELDGANQVELAASIKESGSGLKTWNVKVANPTPGKPVRLNWEKLNVPNEISLVLVDLTAKRKTDLYNSEAGSVVLTNGLESHLQVLAGKPSDIESAIQGLKSELNSSFALLPNYPNPFNPTTLISIEMGREDVLELAIYNSIGQKIKTLYSGLATEGKQQFEWNGKDDSGNPVSSGVYFCTMKAGTFTKTNKMLLTR